MYVNVQNVIIEKACGTLLAKISLCRVSVKREVGQYKLETQLTQCRTLWEMRRSKGGLDNFQSTLLTPLKTYCLAYLFEYPLLYSRPELDKRVPLRANNMNNEETAHSARNTLIFASKATSTSFWG